MFALYFSTKAYEETEISSAMPIKAFADVIVGSKTIVGCAQMAHDLVILVT